ncbi:hypothetical protein KVT40_007261 [Elsinoe batatas]|uniref:Uncharacterized protein n=1 Tax=Elsinoe batatas TaxID=2601811 RepID=A0A8K0L120_9PEZI|nr:hypothetical protein KVT40_007261 [Elsinoe batatas]
MTNDERLFSGSTTQHDAPDRPQAAQGHFDSNLRSGGAAQRHDRTSWHPTSMADMSRSGTDSAEKSTPSKQRYSALDQTATSSPEATRTSSKRHSGGFLLGSSFGRTKRHSNPPPRDSPARDGQVATLGIAQSGATPSPRSSRSLKSQGKLPAHIAYAQRSNGQPTASTTDNMEDGHSEHSRGSQYGSGASRSSEASSIIDPNQLISMALALSDGRRRAASGVSQAPKPISSRRVVSTGTQRTSIIPGSPLSNDLLRKRMSAGPSPYLSPSPEPYNSSPPAVTTKLDSSLDQDRQSMDVDYDFSVSTLQRAERARQYFELSSQYRRLLTCLPPLKPDRTAPGNVSVQTQSVPGSPLPIITRTETNIDARHNLGRPYNPLQYLRNERLRKRQGQHLTPPPADFEDLERVGTFVEQTASRSDQSRILTMPDMVALPRWHSDTADPEDRFNHRRDGTASSRVLWFNSAWSFTPMALFADTLWTESPENKWSIENRRGQRIFPDMKTPDTSYEKSDHDQVADKRHNADHHDRSENAEPRGRHKRKFLSIHKLNDDEGRRRPWRRNRSASSSRASSRSSISAFGTFGGSTADGVNIGPLVRHMQKQMQNAEFNSPDGVVSPGQWDGLPPETEEFPDAQLGTELERTASLAQKRGLKPAPLDLHKSRSFTEGIGQPANNAGDMKRANNLLTPQTGDITVRSASETFSQMPLSATTYQSSNMSSRHIKGELMKSRNPETSYMDFAHAIGSAKEPIQVDEPAAVEQGRPSFESTRSFTLRRHGTNKSVSSNRKLALDSDNDKSTRGHGKSMSRILKTSRIAELVRGETTRKSDRDRKDGTRSPRGAQPLSDASDMSDSDDDRKLSRQGTDMSVSSVSSDKPRYHVPLPSFKFPGTFESRQNPSDSGDPITKQQGVRREQSKTSRHHKMGPPRIEVPDGEDQSRVRSAKEDDSQGLRGLLSPIKRLRSGTGPSRPPSIRPPLSTQNSTTDFSVKASGVVNGELEEPIGRRPRQWSIANQLDRPTMTKAQSISIRDVERVKALFLSSGIKACELCRRGDAVPDEHSDFLVAIMDKTGKRIDNVSHRNECRTAGRLWSEAILSLHHYSEQELQQFRDNKIPELRDRIDQLRHVVGEQLTIKVQSTADDADAFATDLNTHQTLAVKNVHDAIDSLMRRRRRNWRMVRRIGFATLEWLLLGIMWLAWFIFTLFKIVRSVIWAIFKVIRWLSFL